MRIRCLVNDVPRELEVEPRRLLADVLRHDLDLHGVHLGCEHGVCGACTVEVDGELVLSCLTFAYQVDGARVRTVEGLTPHPSPPPPVGERGEGLHPVQVAFNQEHGLQCGFCTPGFVLAATDLLRRHPDPDEATIRRELSGNLCRCTGYTHIVAAVRTAARLLGQGERPR
jgi:carbon-monoxide dehydrogenase small subunit